MAKILYGVHGTGHGHAMRALTIARALPQHEFLFVANDDAPKVLAPEFKIVRLPNLGTSFKNYRVDFGATIKKAVPLLLNQKKYISKAQKIIEDFKPDACMTDLEYFVPRAAKKAGLPCLTLDHQHLLTCCSHNFPGDMRRDVFLQGLTPKYLFKPTDYNLLISFYQPPLLPKFRGLVAPPILREKVMRLRPTYDDHIVVYQSNSTDQRLPDFLKKFIKEKVYVFGYQDTREQSGNITFMPKSEDAFLELLAGAKFIIQGGSHTLMSEALYLGKPIISIPIKAMVEQRLNAFYLEKLGYGIKTSMENLNGQLLDGFLANLPKFQKNIKNGNFCGNRLVFDLVDKFALTGKFPPEAVNA